jgi:hypothetical protein
MADPFDGDRLTPQTASKGSKSRSAAALLHFGMALSASLWSASPSAPIANQLHLAVIPEIGADRVFREIPSLIGHQFT